MNAKPLHLATMAGNAEIVKILLENGVSVHIGVDRLKGWSFCYPGHGPTALHLALGTRDFYHRRGEELGRIACRLRSV
ncbi:hypothetical protein BDW62DRAFT_172975 [Aspergillus aurantiobrunneus]